MNILDEPTKAYKGIPLVKGNSYNIKGEFYEYEGDFENASAVPQKRCCYSVGNGLYVKKKNFNFEKPKERRKRSDDDRKINTNIEENDNTLMVLAKQALKSSGTTRGDIRKMFESTSDMNNMMRQIEVGEKLSWDRFTEMISKLGLGYDLTIYKIEKGKRETVVGE